VTWQQRLQALRLQAAIADALEQGWKEEGQQQPAIHDLQRLTQAVWRDALSLGLQPWQAFAALLSAASALRVRAEALRARAEAAECEAALRRRLAAAARAEVAAMAAVQLETRGPGPTRMVGANAVAGWIV
jgi:hypothetical protein